MNEYEGRYMITSKLDVVDIMLLIDMFPTPAWSIQVDKGGCDKFPIALYSAFPCASRQIAAITEEWYLAVSRIQYIACDLSERQ